MFCAAGVHNITLHDITLPCYVPALSRRHRPPLPPLRYCWLLSFLQGSSTLSEQRGGACLRKFFCCCVCYPSPRPLAFQTALRCVALPCLALRCLALPCFLRARSFFFARSSSADAIELASGFSLLCAGSKVRDANANANATANANAWAGGRVPLGSVTSRHPCLSCLNCLTAIGDCGLFQEDSFLCIVWVFASCGFRGGGGARVLVAFEKNKSR